MSTYGTLYSTLIAQVKARTGLTDVTLKRNRQGFRPSSGNSCRISIAAVPDAFAYHTLRETQVDDTLVTKVQTRGQVRVEFRFESLRNDAGADAWELCSAWMQRVRWESTQEAFLASDMSLVRIENAVDFSFEIDDREVSVAIVQMLFNWANEETDASAESVTIGHVEITGFEDSDYEYTELISES